MKLGLIVPGGVDRSGTHRVIPLLLWVIERLTAAGHEVHVFAHRQEPAPGEWRLLGARVCNAGARPRRLRMLRALAREHQRAPFAALHAFWAVPSGTVAAVARRLLNVRVVLWLPGGDLVSLPEIGYGLRVRASGRAQLALALAGAHRVVVPSRHTLELARTLGIEAERVPFGVALDHWPLAAPRPRLPGAPARLLHVASLNRVKDQPTLLRALARVTLPWQLEVIGEDTLRGEVQALAGSLGLAARVHFAGFLEQAVLRRRMLDSDLLLLASRHETVPLVLREAAACGLPAVGTSVGELAEWAPEAALGVPPGNAAALAAAITSVLADEPLRLRLAASAQERVRAWPVEHTVARLLELSER